MRMLFTSPELQLCQVASTMLTRPTCMFWFLRLQTLSQGPKLFIKVVKSNGLIDTDFGELNNCIDIILYCF